MKYCFMPYKQLYLDNSYGDVWLCQWMNKGYGKIGNLLEQELDEIWFGEKAESIRKQIKENCFENCRFEACPNLQNNDLPEINDIEEYNKSTTTPKRPTHINLAFDSICNQHCETCRPKPFIPQKEYIERIKIISKKILPYLNTAEWISASGHGDPFASPYIMDLLSKLQPVNKNLIINLETNGVYFDEEHWKKINHLKNYCINIVLTSNSFDEFTYKHISRGGNYKKLMHNLEFIKELRKQNYINYYTSSFVIQDRNFREIPSFIKRSLEEFGFDFVVLKPVYQWGKMSEQTYWFKDVLNPKHPYHEEYLEILQCPELKGPKVYNFGGNTEHESRDYPTS